MDREHELAALSSDIVKLTQVQATRTSEGFGDVKNERALNLFVVSRRELALRRTQANAISAELRVEHDDPLVASEPAIVSWKG